MNNKFYFTKLILVLILHWKTKITLIRDISEKIINIILIKKTKVILILRLFF